MLQKVTLPLIIEFGRGNDLKVTGKVIKPRKVTTLEHVMIETKILSIFLPMRIL